MNFILLILLVKMMNREGHKNAHSQDNLIAWLNS